MVRNSMVPNCLIYRKSVVLVTWPRQTAWFRAKPFVACPFAIVDQLPEFYNRGFSSTSGERTGAGLVRELVPE